MLIAVAPHTRLRGVDGAEGDWRIPRGAPGNGRGVRAEYQVAHVDTALRERHGTDAHFVLYVVRQGGAPIMRQPRVNKAGLEWLRVQGYEVSLDGLAADVDNAEHRPWSSPEEARLAVHAVKAKVPTAIVYATRGGLRIVQPLRRPLLPEEAEGAIAAWLGQLEQAGLRPDRACLDWTRHYRLPHVARDGAPIADAPAIVLSSEPIEPPAPVRALRRGSSRRARGAAEGPIAWSTALPPHLEAAVAPIAEALRTVPGSWHDTHLALAGALAKGGVDPAHLPALAVAIAGATGDTRPEDRRTAAETTARRYTAGSEIKGMRWLAQHAPAVAAVVEQLVGRAAPRERPAAPPAPTDLPEVVQHQIRGAVRRASERLSLVVVPCGTGKTHAVRTVAIERAGKPRRADAKRAPLGSRTAISVPTHELAAQVANDVEAVGVPVLRLVGIASYRGANGEPVCAYAAQAGALASGGLSVRLELCEGRGRPCSRRETCEARGGMIGPEDARVVVGPHALVGELDGVAGKTGLLAIDEPPALLRTERVRLEDVDHAIASLGRVAPRYSAGVRPALLAVRAWLAGAADAPPGPIARAWAAGADADALEAAFDALGTTTVEDAAEEAVDPKATSEAPPLTTEAAFDARVSVGLAREIARATRVMRDVRMAATRTDAGEHRGAACIEKGVLVLTLVVEGLRRAMRREGAVVVLAADADLHAPLLAQAIGYAPDVVRVAARLGAPVRRVLLEAPASRTRWLRDGKVNRRAVLEALRAGVDELVRGGVRRALVVTFLAVERELRGDSEAEAILARVGGEVAHFGGLRGLDRWKDADGCLTLGDPRPNLGDVQREIALLREGDASARLDDLAAAELEQAHGRLRLIHRAPDRPALLVHVGEVMPRGWYAPVEVRPMGARQAGELDELRAAVDRAGGTTEAAKILGRTPGEVRRWKSGARAPPPDLVSRLDEASRCSSARGGSQGDPLR